MASAATRIAVKLFKYAATPPPSNRSYITWPTKSEKPEPKQPSITTAAEERAGTNG